MSQHRIFSSFGKIKPLALELYHHHLQRLAQQIFDASDEYSRSQVSTFVARRSRHCFAALGSPIDDQQESWNLPNRSNLRVIAFGANGMSTYEESKSAKLIQTPFVRGAKVDPLGGREMLAVKVTWKQVAWIEGESDVLNRSMYDLEDVHHMPLTTEE